MKNFIIILANFFLCISIHADDAYKDFKYKNLHLRIPNELLSPFVHWKYDETVPFSMDLYYPSMAPRKTHREGKHEKHNYSISVAGTVYDPLRIKAEGYESPFCSTQDRYLQKFLLEKEINGFKKYVGKSPGSARADLIYIPINKIEGVFCITCVEEANCRIRGYTSSYLGIDVFYHEWYMLDEWQNVYNKANELLESYVVQ